MTIAIPMLVVYKHWWTNRLVCRICVTVQTTVSTPMLIIYKPWWTTSLACRISVTAQMITSTPILTIYKHWWTIRLHLQDFCDSLDDHIYPYTDNLQTIVNK